MNLNEGVKPSNIRKVVRDLIDVIKRKQEGLFYLPEDMDYEFENIPFTFGVELDIAFQEEEGFELNGSVLGIIPDDDDDDIEVPDTISITLNINEETYEKHLYDIIAGLNDIVAHELEHLYQENGLRDVDPNDPTYDNVKGDAKQYYRHDIEIPAQIKGFRRKSKVTGKPFEDVVREYFYETQKIHNLEENDIEDLVDFIVLQNETIIF